MSELFSAVSYGEALPAEFLGSVDLALGSAGARLLTESLADRGDYVVRTLEIEYDGGPAVLRRALADAVVPAGANGTSAVNTYTAVVPRSLREAKRKLLIMDVDSTLIQQEVIELLAAHAGVEEEVAAVTEAAMRGELDFAASLHARVATLEGLPATVVDEVRAAVRLSPGARRLIASFAAGGHVVAVVSGGFSQILDPLAEELGLDFAQANLLEVDGGKLTGKVLGAVTDRVAKAEALRRWARQSDVPLEHTIAIGDGANDLDMLAVSGFGIAYNAKPALRKAADAEINIPQLDVAAAIAGVDYAR
ncbi:phosphoserine phosphatase SerB [Arthrobacter sp. H14]|uniref:phosphoserine phosphatase SerB n=1 Tax=Arthrobacter sp. H14 TaxID=1312959 RepID=UPI00047C6995|nr:phosphoserine phosphatase SerB [Arthrobacter sp. H14]